MSETGKRKRIAVVAGTRPEIIKLAPVIDELRKHEDKLETRLILTGQHRELLLQLTKCFDLRHEINLDLMEDDQSLAAFVSSCLQKLEPALQEIDPDLVVAQGDTSTVLAAAMASYYLNVPFAHVEAGLRSHDPYNPFPEEKNRILADHLATLHFAPTPNANSNLINEGLESNNIYTTGNTVVDALERIATLNSTPPVPLSPGKRLIVVTAHRRENFGEPLERICQALLNIASQYPNVEIVYPVHPNPNVQNTVKSLTSDVPNIKLIPPLNYFDFIALLKASFIVLSDSGGIQEELPSLGKPLLVLREVTERPEALDAGCAKLVGSDTELIVEESNRLLTDADYYRSFVADRNPFGDGKASERIVGTLLHHFFDHPLPEMFSDHK